MERDTDARAGTAVSHVGVCVSDLGAALRCWCEGFGFELAEGYDLDDTLLPGLAEALEVPSPVALRSQMIRLGELRVELLVFGSSTVGTPSVRRDQLGLTHVSLRVADLDAAIDRAVGHGATLLNATRRNLGGVELVFLADPDGTRVELMQA